MSIRYQLAEIGIASAFGLLAAAARARGTHARGVGAAGTFVMQPDATLPASAFFVAGRTFPARLRHATLGRKDDACRDVRGASLKLSDDPRVSPLDLALNTGPATLFWDVPTFAAFLRASAGGEAGLRAYADRYPQAIGAAASGAIRAPESFALLEYHSSITFHWVPTDGVLRLVRFRLRADPAPPPPGEPEPEPWRQDRLPEEHRAHDYLRHEWAERLATGPLRYALDLQYRLPTGDLDDYSALLPWPENFWRLGTFESARVLSHAECERLEYRVERLPPELSVPVAESLEDPRSIGRIRMRLYPMSQWGRRLSTLARRPQPRAAGPLDRTQAGRVTGQLVHDSADRAPLHHVRIELWDRKARHEPLGRAESDADGRFAIAYTLVLGGPSDGPDLELRVLDHPYEGDRSRLVVEGPRNCQLPTFHFGAVRVPWWEYDHTLALPRADGCGPCPRASFPGTGPPCSGTTCRTSWCTDSTDVSCGSTIARCPSSKSRAITRRRSPIGSNASGPVTPGATSSLACAS